MSGESCESASIQTEESRSPSESETFGRGTDDIYVFFVMFIGVTLKSVLHLITLKTVLL